MSTADYAYLFKLLIIGDSGVGKSSLLVRYTDNIFSGTYVATIGVDFKIKTLEINGVRVKLQIWDTAGQERFRTITATYYRGAHGIIVVYDVNDSNTFVNVGRWFEEIKQNCSKPVSMVIVGNKDDSPETKQVDPKDLQTVAEDFKVPCVETSAKLNKNVDEMFHIIASAILKASPAQNQGQGIKVTKVNAGSGSGSKRNCC